MQTINLSGLWDVGLEQKYTRQVRVPGLATDPGQPTPGMLWYRRELTLPPGTWTHALLQLKGARFCPQVFINGDRVSQAPGGMTETRHPLAHPALQPGATVTLEIALTSLTDVSQDDASCIPPADRWRSNLSSCLWDEVCLLVGGAEVWQRPAVPAPRHQLRIVGKQLELDGQPLKLRAGTVVWHRWCRDPDAGPTGLAWDVAWFEENILLRLKRLGANTIRFHLGMPPEAFLDACDRHGMWVQAEWSFFHNLDASVESLRQQWRDWLDLCARHPSIVLAHAWNEHEGPEIAKGMQVLAELAPQYPHFVYAHLQIMHPHKYWWSMFENVGCYYDSADEFPQPIMVDEFGGNYLDGAGMPGAYPAVKESLLRFLGRDHTVEQRLELHSVANARVAEYWRRIGAMGFSPFCALGSPADGNHWFMGPIQDARPKPVWQALSAAFAPVSCSLNLWDRNYEPGAALDLPLHYFNDTADAHTLSVAVQVGSQPALLQTRTLPVWSFLSSLEPAQIVSTRAPDTLGTWDITVTTQTPQLTESPVVSSWTIHTLAPRLPAALQNVHIHIPEDEQELLAMAQRLGLKLAPVDSAQVLVWGQTGFAHLTTHQATITQALLQRGQHVLMLDIGPRPLGEGYPTEGLTRHLQGQPQIQERCDETALFAGLVLRSKWLPEPESCFHPANESCAARLWEHLPRSATQLWNGLRGGLNVPAADMDLLGLSATAFAQLWAQRGAEVALLTQPNYMAYELAGYFAFSVGENRAVQQELRRRVQFLVDDAPALAIAINPNAPIRVYDLSHLYTLAHQGLAQRVTPLVCAGKNLTRVPVVQVDFAPTQGRVILSQLLTAGRLARGFGSAGFYGMRYDPAAVQFALNLLGLLVRPN